MHHGEARSTTVDDVPRTRPSLLLRIRDPQDGRSWEEFVGLYTPLVHRYCRRKGLQEADAEDVTQDVLLAVAVAIRKFRYDPRRGSFRAWLHRVMRSKLVNHYEKRQRQPQGSGDTVVLKLLHEQPSPEEQQEWDADFKEHLFRWAAAKIKSEFHESTWEAFWQTAVHGRSSNEVARSLGLNVGAVYTAKSRVTARLAERIKEVSGGEGPHEL
jgi:RNA polymerase sigma-70 factor (ECF subfamily)